jgi:hypothetical protein
MIELNPQDELQHDDAQEDPSNQSDATANASLADLEHAECGVLFNELVTRAKRGRNTLAVSQLDVAKGLYFKKQN